MKRFREIVAYARQGGHTQRFHTMQTVLVDTVGHHSFNVFWLCHFLSTHLHQVERYTLGLAAMAHDLAEQDTGDMPAPAKREMGIREVFNAHEAEIQHGMGFGYEDALGTEALRILKLADAADGALYCVTERMMGNKLIQPAFANFCDYFREKMDDTKPQEVELFDMISELWTNAVL